MQEHSDQIDPSYWLEESFAKSYPLAALRTFLINGNRKSEYRSPLDILIDRGVIDADQYRAGRFIIKLRQVINNNLRTDRVILEYLTDDPTAQNDIAPALLLAMVMKNLKPHQIFMIDKICLPRQRQDYDYQERILNDNDYRWISHCCQTVKDSLDQLKINIDNVLESAKNGSMAKG